MQNCHRYVRGFDSRFGNYARDMLSKQVVDAFPKAGKRGGAFASYDKWIESFVLLNYTDTVDDSFYPCARARTYPWSSRTSPEIPCLRCTTRPRRNCFDFSQNHSWWNASRQHFHQKKNSNSWIRNSSMCLALFTVKSCTSASSDVSTNISTLEEKWPTKSSISGGMKNQKLGGDVVTRFSRLRKTIPGQRFRIFRNTVLLLRIQLRHALSRSLSSRNTSVKEQRWSTIMWNSSSGGSVHPSKYSIYRHRRHSASVLQRSICDHWIVVSWIWNNN